MINQTISWVRHRDRTVIELKKYFLKFTPDSKASGLQQTQRPCKQEQSCVMFAETSKQRKWSLSNRNNVVSSKWIFHSCWIKSGYASQIWIYGTGGMDDKICVTNCLGMQVSVSSNCELLKQGTTLIFFEESKKIVRRSSFSRLYRRDSCYWGRQSFAFEDYVVCKTVAQHHVG